MAADSLTAFGFTVTDRTLSKDMKNIVGYEVISSPPGLRMPQSKAFQQQQAMLWCCSLPRVQVPVVHSLLGMWIFGALLRRELLGAAQHIFRFVEVYE
eukprot:6737244-Heterocapsa_arctica.AAC.1